jgi:uncharacterized protein (TIGR02118 family)
MIKLIILLKRKPGLSREEFRRHYETRHAPLAMKYLDHLLLDYRRNYPQREFSYLASNSTTMESGGSYDAVAEMVVQDTAALEEMYRILADPEVKSVIGKDEATFLDRDSIRIMVCEEERSASTCNA